MQKYKINKKDILLHWEANINLPTGDKEVNDDFKKFEQLLYRMQRDTLCELLLKTQSVEFLDYASRIEENMKRSLMIVNDPNRFVFVKTISYKESKKKINYVLSPKKKRRNASSSVKRKAGNSDQGNAGSSDQGNAGSSARRKASSSDQGNAGSSAQRNANNSALDLVTSARAKRRQKWNRKRTKQATNKKKNNPIAIVQIKNDLDSDGDPNDGDGEDENKSGSEYDPDEELFDDPVDSILASYPYLSL